MENSHGDLHGNERPIGSRTFMYMTIASEVPMLSLQYVSQNQNCGHHLNHGYEKTHGCDLIFSIALVSWKAGPRLRVQPFLR